MNYDSKNAQSIEQHGKRLLNKSMSQLYPDVKNSYSGKGKLGQLVEEIHFGYKPNSNAEADFPEAGVELKTVPLKRNSKGLAPKERLVFNIIDYNEEYKRTFEQSSFWKKNKLLLLMMYLHEELKFDVDYIFKIIRLWEFPEKDLKIIKDDWKKIISKIKAGQAHELSEGDTLYLGACTKGANKKSVRTQPFSDEMAKQRAFSLKPKYIKFIIESSLKAKDSESVIKDESEYSEGDTFESIVTKKFSPYIGKTESQILNELSVKKSSAKSRFYDICRAILGVKKKKIEEFEKADITLKTIRLEESGTLKESMSFPQIKFKEIIKEDWDSSEWHEILTKRFFFVIFQKNSSGELVLKKVMFWTMPNKDLEIAKTFWEDTKKKIQSEDFDNFIKISDNMICHVRPKGRNAKDLMETASGRFEKKKCYWLNSSYIHTIIKT